MTALHLLSATELLDAYRTRRISPVEANRACLDRIAAVDGRLNAFCLVDESSALQSARASEARWARGKPLGLVDGVPTSIEDLMLTRGWPTLCGSKAIDPNGSTWDEDSPLPIGSSSTGVEAPWTCPPSRTAHSRLAVGGLDRARHLRAGDQRIPARGSASALAANLGVGEALSA